MKKFKTYLGLSIKSNQIVIGQDRLKSYNKRVSLLIICPTASKNLNDLAVRLAVKFNCPLIKTINDLEREANIRNCKLLGLTNDSLSGAILSQEDEFTFIRRNNGK